MAAPDSTRSTSSATTAVAGSATDSPSITHRVRLLTVLDIAPTLAMYEQTDMEFARAYYHWFFLIQPEPLPERAVGALRAFLREKLRGWSQGRWPFDDAAFAETCGASRTRRRSTRRARITAPQPTIDLEHDRVDRDAPPGALLGARVCGASAGRYIDASGHSRSGGASPTRTSAAARSPPVITCRRRCRTTCCGSCSRSSSSPRRVGAVERARAAPSGKGVTSPVVVARHS